MCVFFIHDSPLLPTVTLHGARRHDARVRRALGLCGLNTLPPHRISPFSAAQYLIVIMERVISIMMMMMLMMMMVMISKLQLLLLWLLLLLMPLQLLLLLPLLLLIMMMMLTIMMTMKVTSMVMKMTFKTEF